MSLKEAKKTMEANLSQKEEEILTLRKEMEELNLKNDSMRKELSEADQRINNKNEKIKKLEIKISNLNIGSSKKRKKRGETESSSETEYETPEKTPTKRNNRKLQNNESPSAKAYVPEEVLWGKACTHVEPASPAYEELGRSEEEESGTDEMEKDRNPKKKP